MCEEEKGRPAGLDTVGAQRQMQKSRDTDKHLIVYGMEPALETS